MATVQVIFCNDSPELVILDNSQPKVEMDRLALAHYEKNKWSYIPLGQQEPSYEYYRQICFWHVHEVYVKK